MMRASVASGAVRKAKAHRAEARCHTVARLSRVAPPFWAVGFVEGFRACVLSGVMKNRKAHRAEARCHAMRLQKAKTHRAQARCHAVGERPE